MLKRTFYLLFALGIFLFAQNTAKAAYVYEWDNPSYPNLYASPEVLGETTAATDQLVTTDYKENVFAVTSPVGGESWQAGETYTITWSNPSYLNKYLRYLRAVYVPTGATISINDGTSLNLLEDGKMTWTIPKDWPISGQFKIRVGIQPESYATPYVDSGIINIKTISVLPTPTSTLSVISPATSVTWHPSETHAIAWTNSTSLNTSKQKIQAVHLATGTIFNITDSNTTKTLVDGTVSWAIPADLPYFGEYKIRVGTLTDAAVYADSGIIKIEKSTSLNDDIPKAALIVTSPKSGEVWKAGETHTVTWSTPWFMLNYLRYLKAVHVATGGEILINDGSNLNSLEDGTMTWTIPADWPLSGQFKIRVGTQPAGYNTPYDDSEIITINALSTSTQSITVNSPKLGEVWKVGETHTISWKSPASTAQTSNTSTANGSTVTILLMPASPACVKASPPCYIRPIKPYEISLNAPDTGTYNWTIPTTLDSAYQNSQVIAVSSNTSNASGQSSEFIIASTAVSPIIVTSPKAGDNWLAGNKYEINWQWLTENPILESEPVMIVLGPPEPACLMQDPPCLPVVVKSHLITEATNDTGMYSWIVPTDLSSTFTGTQVITVTKLKDTISGKSNQFTIVSKNSSQSIPGITEITADAGAVRNGLTPPANLSTTAQASALDTAKILVKRLPSVSSSTEADAMSVEKFIAYGTPTTYSLGAGERAGVIASFVAAFGKLPSSESDWLDCLKIANGRWPSLRSAAQEAQAVVKFKEIYKRDAQRNVSKYDDAALVVITYGLRPAIRSLVNEAAAIKSFKAIYGKAPNSTKDWDIIRAIAYSGASHELKVTNAPDADQDGLSDADEAIYKTDPNVADTDGDGYSDGEEVKNGYNPLGDGRLSQ